MLKLLLRTLIVSLFFLPAAIAVRSSNGPGCWGRGDFFDGPPNDLVAQSRCNNLGRSHNSKNLDTKKFFPVTNSFREKPPKQVYITNLRSKQCSVILFTKLKILGTPNLCWVDQVKFEF